MRLDHLQNSPVGHLVPITVTEGGRSVDHFAFVPAPLPERLELSQKAWAVAIDAAHHLGRLDAIASELLPNPTLLARPTIRREAVSTSALEGTYAPAAEVLSSEVDEGRPRSQAVVEVLNFVRATEQGIRLLGQLPICMRMACELQGILVKGTPSEDYQAGRVRQTQVIIGPYKGCGVKEAIFIPPPPGKELNAGLTAWERWTYEATDLHAVVRIALAHYQFEVLHPFTDGNGRIGRLLAILQLIEYGLLREPLINLSPFFEAHEDKYRHLLRQVSETGAVEEWVVFFCQGLQAQAKDAEMRIRDLLGWRDAALAVLRDKRVKGVALEIAAKLIAFPTVTVKFVADAHGVSNQAANNAVGRLVKLGVLEEVTGRTYKRVFQTPAVLDILFRPTRPDPNS